MPDRPSTDRVDQVVPGESWALLDMLHGSWKSQALCVAARLGLADLLADGPHTSQWLAAATRPVCHEPSLRRLLDGLCSLSVVRVERDGRYALTDRGQLLRSDVPGSIRHWAIWWGVNLWPVWGQLGYSVTTGLSARAMLIGTKGFEHLSDPAQAEVFHRAMAELTALTVGTVVGAHDFGQYSEIIDVGGGEGELLAAILLRWPALHGTLLDLPHAASAARARMAAARLGDRCACVAGDFFGTIVRPEGACRAAFMLKSVLHDWSDEDCVRILAVCRRAARLDLGDRLVLVEQVLPDVREPSAVHQSLSRSDLTMLVAHGAGERMHGQFRTLIQRAGWTVDRCTPAGPTFSVMEASPSA